MHAEIFSQTYLVNYVLRHRNIFIFREKKRRRTDFIESDSRGRYAGIGHVAEKL